MTNDLHHLAAAYALDALTDEERRDFEQHHGASAVTVADVAAFRETAAHLAEAVKTPPPEGLRASVMADIAQQRQLPPVLPDSVVDLAERRRRDDRRPVFLAAAAAVAVAVLSVGWLGANRSSTSGVDEVIAAPDAVVSSLDGTAGSVQVVWSAELDQVAVLASGLPAEGEGRAYELWFLLDDGVTSAGLFNTSDGAARIVLDVADLDPLGWGVTNEPATGSPQPTGDILYVTT